MSSHRAHPILDDTMVQTMNLKGPDPMGAILYDDCRRCSEYAKDLLNFDATNMRRLWDRMIQVEKEDGTYRTMTEAKACWSTYCLAVWLERNLGIDPWVPLVGLRCQIGVHWPPGISVIGGVCVECGRAIDQTLIPPPTTGRAI